MPEVTALGRRHKAGTAARQGVEAKRRKYPDEKHPGATLVPFVLESLGQPSDEAVQLLQTFAPQEAVARAEVLRSAYYQLSTLLAMRQAELQMSAEGVAVVAAASAVAPCWRSAAGSASQSPRRVLAGRGPCPGPGPGRAHSRRRRRGPCPGQSPARAARPWLLEAPGDVPFGG